MAQRNGDGSIRVSASVRDDEGWLDEHRIHPSDPDASRVRLRALFDDWDGTLGQAIAASISAGGHVEHALRRYEDEIFPRATAVALHSRAMEETALSIGAADKLTAVFGGAAYGHG